MSTRAAPLLKRCWSGGAATAVAAGLAWGLPPPVRAQNAPAHFTGDTGVALMRTSATAQGTTARTRAIPYLYANYGPAFIRIDTLGLRTLALGPDGDLEFVARLDSSSGFDPSDAGRPDLPERENPAWVGVGTFQLKPYGGFFLHAFHDVRHSRGTWVDAVWALQFDWGQATLSPHLGVEWTDARINRYLWSTPPTASAPGYQATDAWQTKLGMQVDIPLAGSWRGFALWQTHRQAATQRHSPLSCCSHTHLAMVGVTYRWR